MSVTMPSRTSCLSISKVLFWLIVSLLIYPLCLLVSSAWDYWIGDGALLFTQLHDFLYTFEYGSKRQALANLTQLGLACLWAGLISLTLVILMYFFSCVLLRNAGITIRRATGLAALSAAALAMLLAPGMIGPLVLIAALFAITTSRILERLP